MHADARAVQDRPTDIEDLAETTSAPTPESKSIGSRTVDGIRIRYADSGSPAEQSIVLTSPWPESVYALQIWPSLAKSFRLFAVDLPGFGGSEGSDELISPHAMGEFLIRLIDEFQLGNPHLVGPDVGTSAALFAAASPPGLLSSVVVGSGGAAVPIQLGGALEQWVLAPDSKLAILNAGHFVWEEAAGSYPSIIADWVSDGYLDAHGSARATVNGGE